MKDCPCGSGRSYTECCLPYISGKTTAPTAEALMRSRYSAYVEHEIDYIMNTCVRNDEKNIDRKSTSDWSEKSTWLGLTIISTEKGGPLDSEGTVEFKAEYKHDGLIEVHHEIARFKKEKTEGTTGGAWLYDDGQLVPHTIKRDGPKTGRNDSCPCGSGKKYKFCCGR